MIDYKIINKIRQDENALEALFFGLCGWLDISPKDEKTLNWQREYRFLKSKYNLGDFTLSPKYSKLRPPNFPNIRLSQLASLLNKKLHLFSKIKDAKQLNELRELLIEIKASNYWDNHYNFCKISNAEQIKKLSNEFINLIIINCFLPLKYYFERESNPEIGDQIMDYFSALKPEKNSIIEQWTKLGIKMKSSLDSQAYLHHYKENCLRKNCLNCSIGFQVLKNDK